MRADDASFSNLRALIGKRRFFLIFYDVSIARKSEVNSGFSRVSFGEFFENFAHFEIKTLSLIYPFLKKICQSNSV